MPAKGSRATQHTFTLRQNPSPPVDVKRGLAAVSSKVRKAALEAHDILNEAGIPHLLVGGLAVGAHGYAYATQDVDFLVDERAFIQHKGVVSFAPGIPILIHGIQIDYLSATKGTGMKELLEGASGSKELCVIPIEQLVYMKLVAHRAKDQAAIVELARAGMDTEQVRAWLVDHAPSLVTKLDRLLKKSQGE